MKKVLFVATVVKKHINYFHIPTLKLFKESGWETSVCARNDFEIKEECKIPYCDKYYDVLFERNPFKIINISCFLKLKKLIEKEKYDIVYCHTPVGGAIARLASIKARKKGTKVIYMAHGFHFFAGAPKINWLIYYPIEKCLSRYTDLLITINQEDYQRALKFKAKKVEYVPGVGIDLDKFYFDEGIRKKKREELLISDDDFAMLSVGELTKRKNHLMVIEAMHKINNTNLHYYICGSGPLKEKIESLVKQYNLEKNVHLLGFRKDIYDICNACDLFVFPSLQEGLPVALMEAMACRMPVVCTRIRGNCNLIDEEKGGYLTEISSSDLADKILNCLNKSNLPQMGKYNQEVIKQYKIDKILKMMKKIFELDKGGA